MDPICPICATPLEPDPPGGMPILMVEGEDLSSEPGKGVGYTARYCPLGHAVHLRLAWQDVPILAQPADYIRELLRAARDMGLDIPDDEEYKRRLGLPPAGGA
jgi:hypothetical protein